MDAVDPATLVAEALDLLGVPTARPSGSDTGIDLVIEPGEVPIQVKRRALVTEDDAARLLVESDRYRDARLLVVGDRITHGARRLLLKGGAGYYDLRGHLALRTAHLILDTDVDSLAERDTRKDPLAGKAGLEVATALLMAPSKRAAVRELARALDRSPSTISEVMSGLRRDGLVNERHEVPDARLFWQVADRWRTSHVYLSEAPPAGQTSRITTPLRLGLEDVEQTTGWALTESLAAVAYGAPLAARAEQFGVFYVPDDATIRRAQNLLGLAATPAGASCAVRVAPVPAVCSRRVDVETNPFHWPLAHPLFVALDLAQDAGRGREILDAWTPPKRWSRVW
jgi:hypothetical protein